MLPDRGRVRLPPAQSRHWQPELLDYSAFLRGTSCPLCCNTVLCCVVLNSKAFYCIVWCCAGLHCIVLSRYCAQGMLLYGVVLCSRYDIVWCCTALHCIVLTRYCTQSMLLYGVVLSQTDLFSSTRSFWWGCCVAQYSIVFYCVVCYCTKVRGIVRCSVVDICINTLRGVDTHSALRGV